MFPWRALAPFFAITIAYLLYTGFPLFRFGFNWISYANDDMANYCLGAHRVHDRAVWTRSLQRADDHSFVGGSWRSTRLNP